jgi:hypothetical protein
MTFFVLLEANLTTLGNSPLLSFVKYFVRTW